MRKSPICGSRTWTQEELLYLEEKWGAISIPSIAEKLNRTSDAVKIKASRMGLGPVLLGEDYISLNQLIKAVTGIQTSYSYHFISWVQNRGLPVHTRKVDKCKFRVVYLDEFWKWAEKNRSFIDFSKMEPNILGKEPKWVAQQRKNDYADKALHHKDRWTPAEDQKLLYLLQQQKYGYLELSEILHRSNGAIQRRCMDLGTKYRPVKADNHNPCTAWTEEDYKILADGIRNGENYMTIGLSIRKSEKSIRGKVYYVYLTENLDNVRRLMGSGAWGDGAPDPTVKQGLKLSRTRTDVRKNLSVLDALLRKRINDLGYDPYWQRFMCKNWDDFSGCNAGCANCDSCTEFIRIRSQYCKRCGATFYERKSNDFCPECRNARKKQAQKKWSVMNSKGKR